MSSITSWFVKGENVDELFEKNISKIKNFPVKAYTLGPIASGGGERWVETEVFLGDLIDTKKEVCCIAFFYCDFCHQFYRNHTEPDHRIRFLEWGLCLKKIPGILAKWDRDFWGNSKEISLRYSDCRWTSEGKLCIRIVNKDSMHAIPSKCNSDKPLLLGRLYYIAIEKPIEALKAKKSQCAETFCRDVENLALVLLNG